MSKKKSGVDTKFKRLRKTRKKILKTLGFFITAILTGLIALGILTNLTTSPRESKLLRENQILKTNYELLQKRMDYLNATLNDIQNRDDNLYRLILNADPIPEELRYSGLGGVNKYSQLEKLSGKNWAANSSKKLDSLIKRAYVQSKSFDEVEELAKQKKTLLSSVPAIMPIRKELLRTPPGGYGMRIHPVYKIWKMHKGMDFAVPSGSDIFATGDGIVTEVTRGGGYGIHVVIKHNYGGYETLYAHMIRAKAKKGDKVKRGDVIGYVGSTGTSTAPHVHYEVRKNGQALNPINFYTNDLSPEEYEKIIHETNTSMQSFD